MNNGKTGGSAGGAGAEAPDPLPRLGEPVEKRGHRRPADDFFRSLAQEQKAGAPEREMQTALQNGRAYDDRWLLEDGKAVPGERHALDRTG